MMESLAIVDGLLADELTPDWMRKKLATLRATIALEAHKASQAYVEIWSELDVMLEQADKINTLLACNGRLN